MTLAQAGERRLGRFVEPALWVLIALGTGAATLTAIFDAVRRLDGPIGHGTVVGALSRLERLGLVEIDVSNGRATVYRLTILGRVAAGSASILKGQPA